MKQTVVKVTWEGEDVFEKVYDHQLDEAEKKSVVKHLRNKYQHDDPDELMTIKFEDQPCRCKDTAELF